MSKQKSKSKKRVKLFDIEKYSKKFFPRDIPIPSHNLEAQYSKVSEDKSVRMSPTHFEHPTHWARIAA